MPKAKEIKEVKSEVEESEAEVVVTKPTVPEKSYRVFDSRANLVAQVTKEPEAIELAAKYNGFYKALS